MAPMVDRISELPDEILFLILSFLPTEDAIVLSLVSKRWRSLWLLVPTLYFDERKYQKRSAKQQRCWFVDFVWTILQARGSRQPIKAFRLSTCNHHKQYHVERWLNKAIQRGVENVEVDCEDDCYPGFNLPSNILNCTTLVVLKLRWASFENGITSVYLPSLKTLHLNSGRSSFGRAHFLNPQEFMEFLYGCPILENLIATDLLFHDFSFEGKSKSLSKLVTAEVYGLENLEEEEFHIPLKVFSNVKFLSLDQCNEDIPMFPNLIQMELIDAELKWNSVLDMLKCSPNLETLVLDFKYSSCEDWPNLQFVPECFSSTLKKCVITNYTGAVNQMIFVKYVMQNSSSLRVMTVNYSGDDHQKRHKMLTELASCPRSSATCQLLFK